MNEADTCRKLVCPKLEASGWDGDKHFYSEQTSFTDGRTIVPGGKPRRLKKKFSDFLLRYLWHMLRSGIVHQKAWAAITGTAQPTVPLKAVRMLPLPVPPVSVQDRPVAYLDEVQTRIDEVQSRQRDGSKQLTAMLPAILSDAFNGRMHHA